MKIDEFTTAVMNDPRFLVDQVPLLSLVQQVLPLGWTRDPFDRLLAAHSAARRKPLCSTDYLIRHHHMHVPAILSRPCPGPFDADVYLDHYGQEVDKMPRTKDRWSVADAKANLSKVIDRAVAEGPQRITRRKREVAVVVSSQEWQRRTARKGTLAEFFASSPLRGSGLAVDRRKDTARKPAL